MLMHHSNKTSEITVVMTFDERTTKGYFVSIKVVRHRMLTYSVCDSHKLQTTMPEKLWRSINQDTRQWEIWQAFEKYYTHWSCTDTATTEHTEQYNAEQHSALSVRPKIGHMGVFILAQSFASQHREGGPQNLKACQLRQHYRRQSQKLQERSLRCKWKLQSYMWNSFVRACKWSKICWSLHMAVNKICNA
jgi:hypothetical protein